MLVFKKFLNILRQILYICLIIGVVFSSLSGNYSLAILDLLLIIVFELQDLNDNFKL